MGTTGETPAFANDVERQVWRLLEVQKGADWVVLANLRITDEKKDHELDLVVLVPGAGVVVLEVKGGSIWVDDDGRWRQNRRPDNVIHPVRQAREGKYALREYVERDPRWRGTSRTRFRWGHLVVVPQTRLDDDFSTPDCPRWAISGAGNLDHLAERVVDVVARQEGGCRRPTDDDVELVREILTGRALPLHDVAAEADEREQTADRLTSEQAALLQVTRLIPRLEVRGGAGSGKTILALTQAKDLTRGQEGRAPQRVALVCYSIGLSQYFRRHLDGVPRRHRPAFVGSFEDLANQWGIDTATHDRNDAEFWEHDLAERMTRAAEGLPDGHRFDTVIVDEAQDFADSWWLPLMRSLRDEETGGLYVYSDENQRVFPRFGQPPVPLVPLVLDHNLRNTQQIAKVFQPLAPMRMHARGGNGAEVRFVAAAADDALDVADEQVDALLERGWRPEHVALMTMGSRHPVQAERQEAEGHAAYWRSFWDDADVFYGHVLGCKGLERRAVVLCVNTEHTDRAREKLYVGMSRATDELVVVGDPDFVRRVGGDAVAHHLGITG